MSIEKRLQRLEGQFSAKPEAEEKWREAIKVEAQRLNASRAKDGEPPLFEIEESGDVFCACDGKPVTEFRQTLAELWYHEELEGGDSELVHDEEAEAFYTQSGHLAVSRDYVDLSRLMGGS